MKLTIFIFLFLAFLPGLSAQTVIVNPNGTHSVGINHGVHTIVVNSNGTHSLGVNHGAHTVVVNPDGTHSIGVNHGAHHVIVHPLGTHSIELGIAGNTSDFKDFMPVASGDSTKGVVNDSLFLRPSKAREDEFYKLKVLRNLAFISQREYWLLKKRNRASATFYQDNSANRLFDLGSSFCLNQLSGKAYKEKKKEVIHFN